MNTTWLDGAAFQENDTTFEMQLQYRLQPAIIAHGPFRPDRKNNIYQ